MTANGVRVQAPGKLLLTGAYAVLEGAPAVVVAVDRRAVAECGTADEEPSPEVRAAFGAAAAPRVDVTALRSGDRKLGLGLSAAALVACLGARAVERGEDLSSPAVRDAIFAEARAAHAAAQSGGSGVDVAASTYGGALRYVMSPTSGPVVRPAALPRGLVVDVFWSGESARTSGLRARVGALRERDASLYEQRMHTLVDASERAAVAVDAADLPAFLAASRAFAGALAALGRDADAPIVGPRFSELAELAARDGAVFFPSGAGGGDVAVFLSDERPSSAFSARAESLGMHRLAIGLDRHGVRVSAEPPQD